MLRKIKTELLTHLGVRNHRLFTQKNVVDQCLQLLTDHQSLAYCEARAAAASSDQAARHAVAKRTNPCFASGAGRAIARGAGGIILACVAGFGRARIRRRRRLVRRGSRGVAERHRDLAHRRALGGAVSGIAGPKRLAAADAEVRGRGHPAIGRDAPVDGKHALP